MTEGCTAVRGAFFDLLDDPWKSPGQEEQTARFLPDGLLVIKNGLVADFGSYSDVAPRHLKLHIHHLPDRIIVPGFMDGHVHFPQVRVMGAYGEQLFDWLKKWVFPEELKYRNRDYARQAAGHFFDALLAAGTTTCQAFSTSDPVATEEFFAEAMLRRMRVIAGLTGIDRFAPTENTIAANHFYHETVRLIDRYHEHGRCLYAITPRFAVGCSDAMMEACRRLRREYPGCWVNTHIAETPFEVRCAREQFPACADYTAVQEKYELLGPKFTAGHGIYLSNDELRRFARAGAAISFCPLSNLFLGSGLFRLGRATDPAGRVRLSIGSDVGAGNSFSLLRVLEEGYKVGMCNNASLLEGGGDPAEAERSRLNPCRAFYLATLGGARSLYLDHWLGNFEIGKEADFVVLDYNAGQRALRWRQSLALAGAAPQTVTEALDLLFGLMMLGDDRSVQQTWVAGNCAYDRHKACLDP